MTAKFALAAVSWRANILAYAILTLVMAQRRTLQRLSKYQQTHAGFTIVELLIVIVIIAILAAITIVAYNGITQQARVAALQSDLSNGYGTLGSYQATNGTFPASQTSANLASSPGNTLIYTVSSDGTSYCLQASYNSTTYAVTDNNNVPAAGYCAGTVVAAGTQPVVSQFVSSSAGSFNGPAGLVMDNAGNLYVDDSWNNCIKKITPAAVVTTFVGTCKTSGHADGTGTAATFLYPNLAQGGIDSAGNFYVADGDSNDCVRKVTAAGVVTTIAGGCGIRGSANGTGTTARFNGPSGIAVDASGNLYMTDKSNNCIREISPAGVVTSFAGNCGGSSGYADGTGTAAQFNHPMGITIDSSGNLYVTDNGNNCIRKITPAAVVSTFAGQCATSGSTAGYIDGASSVAKFKNAVAIAIDSSGNLYVADDGNSRVRKITPSGQVSTLAGNGVYGYALGVGSAAEFRQPDGLAIDSSGAIYLADWQNGCIFKITQ